MWHYLSTHTPETILFDATMLAVAAVVVVAAVAAIVFLVVFVWGAVDVVLRKRRAAVAPPPPPEPRNPEPTPDARTADVFEANLAIEEAANGGIEFLFRSVDGTLTGRRTLSTPEALAIGRRLLVQTVTEWTVLAHPAARTFVIVGSAPGVPFRVTFEIKPEAFRDAAIRNLTATYGPLEPKAAEILTRLRPETLKFAGAMEETWREALDPAAAGKAVDTIVPTGPTNEATLARLLRESVFRLEGALRDRTGRPEPLTHEDVVRLMAEGGAGVQFRGGVVRLADYSRWVKTNTTLVDRAAQVALLAQRFTEFFDKPEESR